MSTRHERIRAGGIPRAPWAVLLIGLAACAGQRLRPIDPLVPSLFVETLDGSPLLESSEGRALAEAGFAALASSDLESARRDFRRLLKSPPEGLPRAALEPAHSGLGAVWLAAGDVDMAAREFAQALVLRPGAPAARLGEAAVLHVSGDDAEAWARLERLREEKAMPQGVARLAARVKPRLQAQLLEQGRALAAGSDLAGAAQRIEQAAALETANATLWLEAGKLAMTASDHGRAARDFAAAAAATPGEPEPWIRLAEARIASGELDGARAAIERAVKLPQGRELSEAMVERLRQASQGAAASSAEMSRALASPALDRAGLATLLVARLPLLQRLEPPRRPVLLVDVAGSGARAAIQEMVGLGVLVAYENHRFRPQAPVSRAELAQAIAAVVARFRAAGRISERPERHAVLADVPPEHVFHGAVREALRYGVLSLDRGGLFHPAEIVSGAEAAAAIERLAALVR